MGRRELRERIFKLLFRIEFNGKEEMIEQTLLFFETEELASDKEDTEYIQSKYESIMEKLDEIDEAINQEAECWTISRMGKVDLTILRLAIYEIKYDDQVPTGVAINEAVEIAKKFGQEESSAFINGILSKFAE